MREHKQAQVKLLASPAKCKCLRNSFSQMQNNYNTLSSSRYYEANAFQCCASN